MAIPIPTLPSANLVWPFIKLGFWLGLGIGTTYFFLVYKYIVIIRQQRGTGQKIRLTFAKRVENGEFRELRLLFPRKTTAPFPRDTDIHIAFMMFEFIEYYSDANSQLHPVKFGFLNDEQKSSFLYPENINYRAWHVLKTKHTINKYKNMSTLEKYAPLISIGICAMVLLVTVVISYKQLDKVIEITARMGNNLANALTSIKAPPIT